MRAKLAVLSITDFVSIRFQYSPVDNRMTVERRNKYANMFPLMLRLSVIQLDA